MRVRNKFCTAAVIALSAVLAVSVPVMAEQVVVGTAPAAGASETSETSETSAAASSGGSSSATSASTSSGISSGRTTSGSSSVTVETGEAPAAETTAAETTAAETTAKSTAAPETTAARSTAAPETTAARSTAAPETTAKSTVEVETAVAPTSAAPETTASSGAVNQISSSAEKPQSENLQDSGVSDEEQKVIDELTGPGVSLVHAGDHGVNEPTITGPDTDLTTDWDSVSALRKQVVAYAEELAGSKYTFGGDDPEEGFDCSGFVMYVMKNAANIDLYHQSAVQAAEGVSVTTSEMRPGDLVAYDGVPKDGQVNHIAIYVGDGKAIHAVGTGKGVQVTKWDYANPITIRNVLGD